MLRGASCRLNLRSEAVAAPHALWRVTQAEACGYETLHHLRASSARVSRFAVIRCTRGSGPCGRLQCDQGSMWPGGEPRACDQKIVEALKTKFPFGPE